MAGGGTKTGPKTGATKSVADRIRECAEIRSGLQRMGALTDPHFADKIKRATNEFVRDGTSHELRHTLPGVRIRITLTDAAKSGVTVEMDSR